MSCQVSITVTALQGAGTISEASPRCIAAAGCLIDSSLVIFDSYEDKDRVLVDHDSVPIVTHNGEYILI